MSSVCTWGMAMGVSMGMGRDMDRAGTWLRAWARVGVGFWRGRDGCTPGSVCRGRGWGCGRGGQGRGRTLGLEPTHHSQVHPQSISCCGCVAEGGSGDRGGETGSAEGGDLAQGTSLWRGGPQLRTSRGKAARRRGLLLWRGGLTKGTFPPLGGWLISVDRLAGRVTRWGVPLLFPRWVRPRDGEAYGGGGATVGAILPLQGGCELTGGCTWCGRPRRWRARRAGPSGVSGVGGGGGGVGGSAGGGGRGTTSSRGYTSEELGPAVPWREGGGR